MKTSPAFLAAGQRYAAIGSHPWRAEEQITIVHVGRDGRGTALVTYRCPGGQLVTAAAVGFEAAVAEGQIAPVVGTGRIAHC
jgi:hypothetical protein